MLPAPAASISNVEHKKGMETAERQVVTGGLKPSDTPRCSYELCETPVTPQESSKWFVVDQNTDAGGRDWSSLQGRVLCQACFGWYMRKGTLERTRNKPLEDWQKRCSYSACLRPEKSSQ